MIYKDILAKQISNMPENTEISDIIKKVKHSVKYFKFVELMLVISTYDNLILSKYLSGDDSQKDISEIITSNINKRGISAENISNKLNTKHNGKEFFGGRYIPNDIYMSDIRKNLRFAKKYNIDASWVNLSYLRGEVYFDYIIIKNGVRAASTLTIHKSDYISIVNFYKLYKLQGTI